MTGFMIATTVLLAIEVAILRFAESRRARHLVFDAFLCMLAVTWSIYVIAQIHFTLPMLIAVVIMAVGVVAITNFIRNLKK